MKEQLQTQVQNPPCVRDSPKPWLSPDRFRVVNLVLHLCQTPSEMCINVINTYTSLLIHQHQHQILMKTCKNVFSFSFSYEAVLFWSLCPFAWWLMERSSKIHGWEKLGIMQALNATIIWVGITFYSLNLSPLLGKMGCTQKAPRRWLPEGPTAVILSFMEYFCCRYLLSGPPVPSCCLISLQRTYMRSCVRFCFLVAVATSRSGRIWLPGKLHRHLG